MSKRDQTNPGVNCIGGGHEDTGGTVTHSDNQTITFEIYQSALIQVQHLTGGNGAVFLATFISDTIIEVADVSSLWALTDTDGDPGWAIFKSSSDNTVSIKNYMNGSRSICVTIIGACGGATAPA